MGWLRLFETPVRGVVLQPDRRWRFGHHRCRDPSCGGPYGDRPHDRETKLGIFYAIYGEVLPVGRSPAQTCCPAIWEAWIFRRVAGSIDEIIDHGKIDV